MAISVRMQQMMKRWETNKGMTMLDLTKRDKASRLIQSVWKKHHNKQKEKAATFIQYMWKQAWYNPDFLICSYRNRRLANLYNMK